MKVYIAGKITGYPDFIQKFKDAEEMLHGEGHIVLNPASLPAGLEQDEYMHICYPMIDVCDAVYFLDNWEDSVHAPLENEYAYRHCKEILYQ